MAENGIAEALERLAKRREEWSERGPWDKEPDRETFEHAGLPCIVQRGGSGAWCGYVGVPPSHPWHGLDYGAREVDAEVHGGLTYAEACQGGICHVPKPGEPDNVWWFGFDCDHLGDTSPREAGTRYAWDHTATYKGLEYVKRETRSLADQLAARLPR